MASPTSHWRERLVAAVAVVLALTGCTAPPASVAPSTPVTHVVATAPTTAGTASRPVTSRSAPVTSSATGTGTGVTPVTKVLVVVVENHSLAQMKAGMPYTHRLARTYGYATSYFGARHPSLPNYLAIASGSTHGVTTDAAPADNLTVRGQSVFGRAIAAGLTATVYADAMPQPCALTSSRRYAVKHNPWTYFVDERALCRRHDLPVSALAGDITAGTLPNAGMVVPDLCHDAHDCGLRVADAWFQGWMTRIQTGPDWRAGRLVVVLTADEDDTSAGNRVLTVVAHPSQHGAWCRAGSTTTR
jgi:acid phosphatase